MGKFAQMGKFESEGTSPRRAGRGRKTFASGGPPSLTIRAIDGFSTIGTCTLWYKLVDVDGHTNGIQGCHTVNPRSENHGKSEV